jgi:hypothetical protein
MLRLKGKDYLTPAEYHERKGLSAELVRRYCRTGRLEAVKVSNRWLVRADSEPADYEPRIKTGLYVGLNDLKRGDVTTFLSKRGIAI